MSVEFKLNAKIADVLFTTGKRDPFLIKLEVADNDVLRKRGLSNRKSFMKGTEGMLFMFDKTDFYNFTVRDMLIPIDIIFISRKTTGVNIVTHRASVQPGQTRLIVPPMPILRVAEVSYGFCKKMGITKGTIISIERIL